MTFEVCPPGVVPLVLSVVPDELNENGLSAGRDAVHESALSPVFWIVNDPEALPPSLHVSKGPWLGVTHVAGRWHCETSVYHLYPELHA